jgi:hypothetical protein
MEPIIKRRGVRVVTACPFCDEEFYEREEGPSAELASYVAFGYHLGNCDKAPEDVGDNFEKFLRDLFPA